MSPSVQKGVPRRREVDQELQVVGPGVEVPTRRRHGPGRSRRSVRSRRCPRGWRGTRRRASRTPAAAARTARRRSRTETTLRTGGGLSPRQWSTGRVRTSARSMDPRARGAVSFVACISPAHAPVKRAARALRRCEVPAGPEKRTEGEEDERHLVDVVPAVEDHRRGDRGQEGGHQGRGRAEEAPRPEVRGDERHAEGGRNRAQRHLVDLDVSPGSLQPGREAASGSRGSARGTPRGRSGRPRSRAGSRTCPRAPPRRRASAAGRGPGSAGPRRAAPGRETLPPSAGRSSVAATRGLRHGPASIGVPGPSGAGAGELTDTPDHVGCRATRRSRDPCHSPSRLTFPSTPTR